MDRGTLIHALLLGKGREIVGLDFDDWRKNAAKEQREELTRAGMIPVLRRKLDEAIDAVQIIRERLLDFEIDLAGGTEFVGAEMKIIKPVALNELAIKWDEQGVQCRGMLDYFNYDSAEILDLKTTYNAHPRAIQSHMINHGMDLQHAAYTSGITKLYPELEGKIQMGFVFVECEPPYSVLPVIPIGTMRELGRRKWKRAVNIWKKCIETNTWPSYSDTIYYVEAPVWALNEEFFEHERDSVDFQ
jgi:hypothetical protein